MAMTENIKLIVGVTAMAMDGTYIDDSDNVVEESMKDLGIPSHYRRNGTENTG